jgi:hypothetical protein
MLAYRGHVLRVVANMQDAAMHLRVQRLYTPVEHLREAGQVADIAHFETSLTQLARGPSGRNQVHTKRGERFCELH